MARKKFMIDIFQWLLIIVMSFFCVSLMSSGTQLNEKLKVVKLQDQQKTIVIKYQLINNNDTVYVDRKLDSTTEVEKFNQ